MSDPQATGPEQHPAASENPAVPDTQAQTPVASQTPAVPAAPHIPPQPPLPASAGSPVPPQQPAYPGAPQHVAPPYPGTYAGQGQAFGAAASTQPTTPLAPAAHPETKKSGSGAARITALLVAAALVGGAAGLGGMFVGTQLWSPVSSNTVAGPSTVTVNDTDDVNQTTAVAAKVTPSVVTISVSSGSSGGTGSGVILTDDGYVLTNTHVVTLDGATGNPTIRVTTSDGHVYAATVVGTDPTYDLAVIKLTNASGLTPIQMGDSSKLNVGEDVMAVGSPLGLDNTVTTGIVSALNRSIEIASSQAPTQGAEGDEGGTSPFQFDFGQGQGQSGSTKATIKIAVIQTDAAINPGNSGGALVDDEGKLVGINVAIASAGGSSGSSGQAGNIGVGFSIPSDIANRVAQEIISSGKATHGLLGATVANAASQANATTQGALINSVTADGGAAAAGLQAGDVVTAFNGVPITNAVDLTAQVRAVAGGGKATITYVRNGQTHTADVTLGTLQTS
ncbi:S1C family serine protease [Microbacterium sp. SORGH_AS_0888]|uniref:S1C family serine protease n=1 Tax=Microbacterium sp. SORGH_AS_0888 TaxID=3041791 RepID=UPI002784B31E|nr:trypsin-like peptidase domain-containing protein [Microbacterium sp. SORGH_AS_0888]MDQ1128225.1 putative serine protease PepD [Microbacterium sp. SORGH_AS_0888]